MMASGINSTSIHLRLDLNKRTINRPSRNCVIKYVGDGHERIFVIALLGKTGEQLWALHKDTIRLFEKRLIVRMVSIDTMQTLDWEEI